MATKAQIEAAKKALADGHGIGAAIDAAEEAAWEPIETAPKDRPIFVYPAYAKVSWYEKVVGIQEAGWYLPDEAEPIGDEHATHWQPITEPPKDKE